MGFKRANTDNIIEDKKAREMIEHVVNRESINASQAGSGMDFMEGEPSRSESRGIGNSSY